MSPEQRKAAGFGQAPTVMKAVLGFSGVVFVLLIGTCLFGPAKPKAPETPKEVVYNSEWDGSVTQVEQYLKRSLNDADSYEAVEWSPVQKKGDGSYIVRHKYRAANGFGAKILVNEIFTLDARGNVISQERI